MDIVAKPDNNSLNRLVFKYYEPSEETRKALDEYWDWIRSENIDPNNLFYSIDELIDGSEVEW